MHGFIFSPKKINKCSFLFMHGCKGNTDYVCDIYFRLTNEKENNSLKFFLIQKALSELSFLAAFIHFTFLHSAIKMWTVHIATRLQFVRVNKVWHVKTCQQKHEHVCIWTNPFI